MSVLSQYQQSTEFDFHTDRPWRRSLIRTFKHWMAWKREQSRVRSEIKDLLVMDDRLHRDLGLTRHEVKTATRKPSGARP